MTAPDPGLTADHTFQSGGGGDGYTEPFCFGAECSCGEVYESWVQSADDDEGHDFDLDRLADLHAAHVALVVEQYTNGRTAELEAELAEAKDDKFYARVELNADMQWKARAEKAEAAIARVEKLAHDMRGWCSPHGISVTYSDRIRAALEGEQQ